MMFTMPMEFLSAAILSKDAQAVSDELLRIGSLDAMTVKSVSGARAGTPGLGSVATAGKSIELSRIYDVRRRVEGFLTLANPPIQPSDPADFSSETLPDVDAIEKKLGKIASEIQSLRDGQKDLQDKLLRLEVLRRQAELHGPKDQSLQLPSSASSVLAYRRGSVPDENFSRLERELGAFAAVTIPAQQGSEGRLPLLIVTLKRDDSRVQGLLSRFGWMEGKEDTASLGTGGEALNEIDARRQRLKTQLEEKARQFDELFKAQGRMLGDMWASLRAAELSLKMRSTFARTDSVSLLSGWIPATDRSRVEEGIRRASAGRCHIEWLAVGQSAPDGSEPPVEIKNFKALAPFQTLVTNFGIPRYGTIDPTGFVAIAYLSMFGLMFGDAGHGLVLLLVGALLLGRAKRRHSGDTLAKLIIYCGGAAVIAGLLFGSFFGRPIVPALWFDYHGVVNGDPRSGGSVRDIYDILGITIKFGMAVLIAGFVINWINLIKSRQWKTLLFDKAGLAGGWIYLAGAWMAFYFVGHAYKALPPAGLLLPLLGLPTILLGLKEPIEYMENRKRGEAKPLTLGTILNFVMEWLVGILEVYSGYLANTLSFMRVAGLGIAHVSLMTAFFQIAEMTSPKGGLSFAGILILVLG
ncbi:MAG: V-type ATPase 116kDa subunit family protein, partial [Spirochaetia bacterium]|nr:V-type ATPase 116kDa subunit family protein [Spirochaetia bacterium]